MFTVLFIALLTVDCCMFCCSHRVWFIYYWSESEPWYAYIYLRIIFIISLLCVWVIWLIMASCVMQNSLGKAFSPVYLIAPVQIMTWLNQYHDHCQQILSQIKYDRKITLSLFIFFCHSVRTYIILTIESKLCKLSCPRHLSLLFLIVPVLSHQRFCVMALRSPKSRPNPSFRLFWRRMTWSRSVWTV